MKPFWNKRIPTLFAFAVLVIGVIATAYLTQIGVIPFGNAAPEEIPKEIRITNITDTSFTITYHTDIAVLGSAAIGTDSVVGQVALDDRDQPTGKPQPYKIHSITVRNLKPVTKYYAIVTSGTTTYGTKDNPLFITTGAVITTHPSTQTPLAGEMQLASGEKLEEALVYASTQNGQILSTLVKPTSLYILPLNGMRTEALDSYVSFTNNTVIQIVATDGTTQSQASILAGKSNPVPPLTLSNNYDFTIDTNPVTSPPPLQVGFSALSTGSTASTTHTPIIQRPANNEKFTDRQPLFSGQAVPNQAVQITIHSQENIQKTVTADAAGNWSFRPSQLSPGEHTITIITKDANGIVQTLQHAFTIFPSGTQVAEAATPSAEPTLVITPTTPPTPTSEPTQAPTATPTPTSVSTPSPLPSVTLTPAPTQKPIPPTGSNALVQFGTITLVTTAIGVVLFVLGSGIAL